MNLNTLINLLILGLATLLFSPMSMAQDNTAPQNPDDAKPITITADSLDSKGKKGISIYTGHVILTQGRTQITGQKITLFHPKNQFQQAISLGQPAKFKRFLPQKHKWVTGHADQLTYNVVTKRLILKGHAYIQQGESNTLSGSLITYNMQQKTLSAKSNPKGQDKRIKMTFMPANASNQPKKDK